MQRGNEAAKQQNIDDLLDKFANTKARATDVDFIVLKTCAHCSVIWLIFYTTIHDGLCLQFIFTKTLNALNWWRHTHILLESSESGNMA